MPTSSRLRAELWLREEEWVSKLVAQRLLELGIVVYPVHWHGRCISDERSKESRLDALALEAR